LPIPVEGGFASEGFVNVTRTDEKGGTRKIP